MRTTNLTLIKKAVTIILALMMVMIPTTASAAENETMPVHISVSATPIDVSVPTTISLTRTASTSTDMTVSTTKVTNNSGIGVIEVVSAKMVTGFNSWTLTDYTTTEFEKLGMNTKQYGLAISENGGATKTSLSTSDYSFTDFSVNPESEEELDLYAKAAGWTTAVSNVKVGELVVTVKYKMGTLEAKVGDTTIEFTQGMTWGEWVESDYNTPGYEVVTGNDEFNYICQTDDTTQVMARDSSYTEVDASDVISATSTYYFYDKAVRGY